MVQVYTINGVVGTLLTESDLERMTEFFDGRGKKKYFIPCKKSSRPVFNLKEIKELILGGTEFAQIAEHYGKSVSWLNYKLIQTFGTSSQKNILAKLKNENTTEEN